MDPDLKEEVKQRLLGEENKSPESDGDDFQSCNSDDDRPAPIKNHPFNGSLNSNEVPRTHQNDQPMNEDNGPTRAGIEERKMSSTPIIPNSSTLKQQTAMRTKKKKLAQKKSFLQELVDFIIFCYEFVLIMSVIGSGSILASIPCSIYVMISLLYLGLQLVVQNKKKANSICLTLMGLFLLISLGFLAFKIAFVVLINNGSISSGENDQRLLRSLGIAVTNEEDGNSSWRLAQTFLSDVVAVAVSVLLLVGCILRNKTGRQDLDNESLENLKVTGYQAPGFWIFVVLFFLCLAGIISPSLIALTFVVMSCVGLMSWALHYELRGPIMSVVTYICIFVAAGYITASFIVQIPLINQSNPSWVDWIGLDNFSDANINFKENVSGYAITVLVYITSLIYRKTASRYSQKERYLRQRYPERFINKGKEKVKLKDLIKKKKTTFWDSVLYNFTITIKNPYAHLMVFRLSLFFWIYMWFTFQSLLPMLMLWHSVVFIDRKLYIKALMYVQLPLLWLVMLFNYVINIDNLMMDIFGETFFDNDDHRRFGIWRYEVPFFHLLLQIFTLFYGSFVCYLFREYDKLQAKIEEAKERKAKRRRAKLERAQQRDRSASVRSASMRSGAPSVNDTFISSQNVEKEEPIYTYEIIFRFILKYIDLPLMVVLYIAGCNRIDVYHVILLIIFVLFIMYPDFFRRHFNFILYFIIIVASVKYCYVLLEPEFANHSRINDWFKVFGLDADIEDKIYGRNNLINNNYIIIFTGYIQYAIYTSDFSKNAFSVEQSAKDLKTFANRFPLLMKILIISVESFIMLIPWFTYLIFLIINIINSKNLLNFALLIFNLLLLFWHISASLVTKKSHRRLTRGWKCFTFIAAVFFLIILIFQIGSIEQVANIGFIDDFIDWLPEFITDNHDIIGLESYIGFTKSGRMVKFLAYVAYFNLSVITHRQLERSSNKVRAYEAKKLEPIHELGSESSSDESESIMKVQFSLVYVVHKLKVLWPVFNTISWHSFTILAICMGALAIHWRLSVVSLIYIFMLMVYYALTPFFLQPNIKKSGIEYKKGVTVKEMKELWESEDKRATKRLLALRNQFVIFISFFTIICIGILHLSANFPLLADRYKATSGDFWESLIFISFWSGVNYTEMYGGNSYFQEIWGFIFVLLICAIEKKAQIWLRNKFGYEGSTFESYSGTIKLEDYRGDEDKSKKINNLISEPLEEIKEEDEMIRDSIANTIGEKEKGLDDPEPVVEKELSPEELFEKEKEKKVKAILSMEYRLFLTKTIRVIIFVAVILMAMLSSFYKSNVWGILVLFFAALVSLLDLKFKNLKWFTIVMCILFVLQYTSVLLNVSYETKTSVFPDPFQDPLKPRPIPIPIYRHVGEPFTKMQIVPDQGTELPVPQGWAFFCGFILSRARFNNLWVDFFVVIFMHYFFIYFYSVSYEQDMSLNTKEAVARTINEVNEDVSKDVRKSFSNRDGSYDSKYRQSMDEITEKSKDTNYYEAQKYIDNVKSKLILARFYDGISTAICATSSIISLICLLMIAFQIEGLINLFYIVFCLWFLTRSVNFVFQKNWTFPFYLKILLKYIVILELMVQLGLQVPVAKLHPQNFGDDKNAKAPQWMRVIGLISFWRIDPLTNVPENINISNIVLKCCMYSFIIAQENILQCEEYELFTKKTLSSIRSFSDRKTESMAYLYNNQKLKITVENQFEKDKMMKKLVMVNRQVKKWNTTVFNKSTSKEELEEETRKALAPKEETKEHTKIHEVDEDLEDEKLSSAAPGETSRGQTVVIAEAERQTKDKIRREKELAKEKERNEMTKSQLIRALVKEKCNIIWKVIILTTRYCTNQILLVFSFDKLDEIFEDVKLGETRVYTHIEEKLYEDYKANEKIRDEQELELIEDIDPSEIHKEAEKAMSLVKMLLSLYILLINMILSNTEFFCYLTMIICMIMNGSILSLVYPISIFIYALLEEKRPRKGYWLFILNYTAIVLILKFLFQTYPFSTWIVSDWVSPENDSITPLINSANDFLMALRFGLENLDESGRNFVKFFFFECLILLTVTLHILILIFGGVWTQREIEAESIDAAANRIATNKAIDKQKILMLEKRKEAEEKNGDIQDSFKTESFFDSNEFRSNDDVSVYPPNHKKIFRRRAYSMNNCTEMRQVAYDINEYNEIDSDVLEDRLEEWRQIEEEFAYGGTKFEDYLEMNCKDQITKEKEKFSYEQFQYEYRKELRGIRNDWIMRNRNNRGFDGLKASERSVTFYHYKEPEFEECKDFVIKNKAGESKLAQLLMKIKIALTRSKYFESLFPTIKEQKPGIDLYAPMVVFQVVVIVFMIFFFTRMHPDNTGISPESLTPTTFSNLMVLFVFLQIIVIVLDRYLYLSRDYVVIDEVELEEYDEEASDEDVGRSESISQFDRTSSFDLRSSSANKLLVKGIKSSQQMKMKGKSKETKNLDEEVEEEYEDDDGGDVQLSKTKFNQTLLIKYYLQLALLIIVHILVFWYFPIAANMGLMSTPFCQFGDSVGSECNEVFMNWTLVVFYLLYCGYFFFSALQIRYGLPELRKGNFSMNGYTGINKGMFMGFMSAPFVFELKIIADWTFTRTALDLFQWIKFESIYGDLFVAKCSNKPIMAHPLGQKVPAFMKMVMGCGGLIALIVIIAGPLLLFSALNPLANPNPVLGASLTLNIITNLTSEPGGATNVYQLFNTDNFITVEPISDANYRSISGIRLIRNLDRAQFQQVQLSDVADTSWVISPPAREKLFERIRSAKEDGQTDLPINIELIYAFDRAEPAGQQRVDKPLPIVNILDKNVFGRDDILQKLYTAINPETPCEGNEEIEFTMKNWFIPTVRLPATIKPKLINTAADLLQDIFIRRRCQVIEGGAVTVWWEVEQNKLSPTGPIIDAERREGVMFYTWSEKVTESLASFSIVTFYIVVVLGIGSVIRDVIKVGSEQIFIKDMPKPDSLMLICEGILISRLENNLEREEQLYFILIDIMRSPEIIKMITSSSLKKKENQAIENGNEQ